MRNGKCVLLDRDGVLNIERGDYVYSESEFIIPKDVPEGLLRLKAAGFQLVVVTNQGGISKGIYQADTVFHFHSLIQKVSENAIDYLLYAPWHKDQSKSLNAKPGSLMMERGLALTKSNPTHSWLIGDAERDLIAAKSIPVATILIPTLKERESPFADFVAPDFKAAVDFILMNDSATDLPNN
ncbi:MAG TPA: HAD-IIIA family hydrolase [Catalimonadaceae bacterium]|nr:HAD-IIIA family hydrolase [Catalimonadaceae bacterium]